MSNFGDPLNAAPYRTQRNELPEDLWQPLYDRANIATSVPSSVSFFATPKGQSATLLRGSTASSVAKTYRDTNMENSNVVPTKLFKFIGISLAYIHASGNTAANAADREIVRNGGYFHFRIVDKDILYLPLVALPEINPITAAATTNTATDIVATAGGGGSNVPMYKLPIPITLRPYENFSVSLYFDGSLTLTNTMDVVVMLQGFMRRPT